jgi:hypothetical protein
MKYLTLGYGTAWGGQRSQSGERNASPHTESQGEPIADAPMRYIEPEPDVDQIEEKIKRQVDLENSGYFLIGLKGMMEEGVQADAQSDVDWNNRILIRTVHAEVLDDAPQPSHTEEEKAAYEKERSGDCALWYTWLVVYCLEILSRRLLTSGSASPVHLHLRVSSTH